MWTQKWAWEDSTYYSNTKNGISKLPSILFTSDKINIFCKQENRKRHDFDFCNDEVENYLRRVKH